MVDNRIIGLIDGSHLANIAKVSSAAPSQLVNFFPGLRHGVC